MMKRCFVVSFILCCLSVSTVPRSAAQTSGTGRTMNGPLASRPTCGSLPNAANGDIWNDTDDGDTWKCFGAVWSKVNVGGAPAGNVGDVNAKLTGSTFQAIGINQSDAGTQTQLQSYGFTATETALTGGGRFSTVTGFNAATVPSIGICEPGTGGQQVLVYFSGLIWPHDQYSEITVKVGDNSSNLGATVEQSATANTEYRLWWQNHALGTSQTLTISAFVAGVNNQLVNFTATPAVNDVWRLQIDTVAGANVLTAYQNGTLRQTFTDSTFNATIGTGSPGFQLFNNVIANTQISAWAGGGNNSTIKVDGSKEMTVCLGAQLSLAYLVRYKLYQTVLQIHQPLVLVQFLCQVEC